MAEEGVSTGRPGGSSSSGGSTGAIDSAPRRMRAVGGPFRSGADGVGGFRGVILGLNPNAYSSLKPLPKETRCEDYAERVRSVSMQ
jgi:hypothetical protein